MAEPVAAGRPVAPGLGLGWRRVAAAVAQAIPVDEVERVWLFPPVRRDDREWGTAVLARRVRHGRVRVYTASYRLVVRGRERGETQVSVDDVGETPETVLPEVIRGVQQRAREEEPPVEIAAALWWDEHDGAAAAG
jgi:hypothetical protein